MANFGTLIDKWDENLRRAFIRAVYDIRSQARLGQIISMIEQNNIEGAVRAVGLDPAFFRLWDRALEDAFEAGGRAVMNLVPAVRDVNGVKLTVQFNIRNPDAESWIRQHSSSSIVEIIEDQRNMIREHLQAKLAQGVNPRQTALELVGRIAPSGRREGGVIGLTSSQAEWVRNYQAELASNNPAAALSRSLRDKRFDAALRRASAEGIPIEPALRERMVQSYTNRALKYRADSIARTETMAALHQSQEEAIRQGISSGSIDHDNVTEVWHASKDDRTRDSHREMDGQEVARGEPFITGNGVPLMFPGDPNGPPEEIINCRCWREIKVDHLAGVT